VRADWNCKLAMNIKQKGHAATSIVPALLEICFRLYYQFLISQSKRNPHWYGHLYWRVMSMPEQRY
jgi:hypothetical protein